MIGSTEADVKRVHQAARCGTPTALLGDRVCNVATTYGGAVANISYFLVGDRMESATVALSPKDFDDVVTAMRERYGAPKEQDRRETTKGGLSVNNPILSWSIAESELTVRATKYAGRLDRSSISFTSFRYLKEFVNRSDESTKKRASDL